MSTEPARDDSLAVAALILGVVSLAMLWWYVLSIPIGIAAIASGYAVRRRRTGSGSGVARIGMLCGSLALILCAVIIILPD